MPDTLRDAISFWSRGVPRVLHGPQELMHLVAELIKSKVDVIVTAGTSPTRAAKAAAGNLPIV